MDSLDTLDIIRHEEKNNTKWRSTTKSHSYLMGYTHYSEDINHWQLNWLFRLASKETSKVYITGLLWGETTTDVVDSPHKGPVIQKVFQRHAIIMVYAQMAGNPYIWTLDKGRLISLYLLMCFREWRCTEMFCLNACVVHVKSDKYLAIIILSYGNECRR